MPLAFCPLFSGSSGNAIYVSSGDVRLLVDAGVSGLRTKQALLSIGVSPEQLTAILVTHEHADHTMGVGVLSRRYNLPVYATGATWRAMLARVGAIEPRNVREFQSGSDFFIGDMGVVPFSIPHDAADPVGFCFETRGLKASVATDLGYIREDWLSCVSGSDILLLESNHDVDMLRAGPYPYDLKHRILSRKGHLSNDDAGRAAVKLAARGVRHFMLGHLSAENNFPELALETVCAALRDEGIVPGEDIRVELTWRDRVSSLYVVG